MSGFDGSDGPPEEDGGVAGVVPEQSILPAFWSGLMSVVEGLTARSEPNEPAVTIPAKRVATILEGELPERASARSSTPVPQVNAAGSIAPASATHASPPGTFATMPAAHARPTTPVALDAARAALSQPARD